MDDASARFREAFERWLWALYYRGNLPTTEWAVTPDAVVLRHIADSPSLPPPPPQELRGPSVINEWLQAGPPQMVFAMVPDTLVVRDLPSDTGPVTVGETRYEVTITTWKYKDGGWVPELWSNRGRWRAWLAGDGRIARLEHMPDALVQEAPPPAPHAPTGALAPDAHTHGHGGGDHQH